MPIQVLPQQQDLGTGLGSGIANSLKMLAEHKIGALHKKHEHHTKTKAYSQLGLSPEVASGIAGLPDDQAKLALEEYLGQYGLGGGRGEGSKARALQAKQDAEGAKESHKFLETTLNEAKGAKDSDKRLGRMEELVKNGSLPNSTLYRFFKTASEAGSHEGGSHILGSFAGMALNPVLNLVGGVGGAIQRNVTARDTEEFEKLSADFVRGLKDIFGSRVTNLDLQTFMQTVPNLMQTDQGKLTLIRNLRNANKLATIKADTAKQIIKANGGRRPVNLQILVDEATQQEQDQLAQEFKQAIPSVQ